MNYHPCTTPGCTRSTYHPNQRLCLECEAARLDAERESEQAEPDPSCGVDELFEEEEE